MKKMKLKLLFAIFSAVLIAFSSCKKDEEEVSKIPKLNQDFSFTVDANDVTFITTLIGTVFFTDHTTGTEHSAVDGEAIVNLPIAGTYPFTCTHVIDGENFTSDTFNVTITVSDLTYLDSGLWLYLTGGRTGQTANPKTWRMDMNADGKCIYFAGPMYFSGYADGDDRREEWSYWAWDVLPEELPYTVNGQEQTSFLNWSPDYPGNTWIMAPGDYGTITFNGVDKTVSTTIFGVTESGTFDLDDETWKLTINGVILPTDTARLNDHGGQYEENDLHNVRIFALSDSAMQIGIKRTTEGGNLSQWVNVYNFICDDYNYPVPEEFTYTEPVKTSFAQADLEGTWIYDSVAQDWIGWTKVGDQGTTVEAKRLNSWSTRAEMVTTLASWGGKADSIFTANDAKEYVFNNDGSCTLAGVANTYTVSNGVITFGTALVDEISVVFFGMTGTSITVLDVKIDNNEDPYTYEGIWIGQKNGDKFESSAVHLIKKP